MHLKHLLALGLFFLIGFATAADEPPQKQTSIFSELRVGQSINLNDEGATYSLSYHQKEIALSHKVVEIGNDFVVLEDVAGVSDIRMQVYAIKGITVVKK